MTTKLPTELCPTLLTDTQQTLDAVMKFMDYHQVPATSMTAYAGEVEVLAAFDYDSPGAFAAWLTALGVEKLNVTARSNGRVYFEPRPDVRYRKPSGLEFATARACVHRGVRFLLTGIVEGVTRSKLGFVIWDRDERGRMARSGRGVCSAADFVRAYGPNADRVIPV